MKNRSATQSKPIESVSHGDGRWVNETWALPVPGGWIVYCYLGPNRSITPEFAAITSTFVSDPDHMWRAPGAADTETKADQND